MLAFRKHLANLLYSTYNSNGLFKNLELKKKNFKINKYSSKPFNININFNIIYIFILLIKDKYNINKIFLLFFFIESFFKYTFIEVNIL